MVIMLNGTDFRNRLGIATAIAVLWTQLFERHLYEKKGWNSLETWGIFTEIWMLM
jgi:hypothetical protein